MVHNSEYAICKSQCARKKEDELHNYYEIGKRNILSIEVFKYSGKLSSTVDNLFLPGGSLLSNALLTAVYQQVTKKYQLSTVPF
jgi:hypothetical protein